MTNNVLYTGARVAVAVFLMLFTVFYTSINAVARGAELSQEYKEAAKEIVKIHKEIIDDVQNKDNNKDNKFLNKQFIDEMQYKKEHILERFKNKEESGEAYVKYRDIASMNYSDLPIPEDDAKQIIALVKSSCEDLYGLINAFDELESSKEIDEASIYTNKLHDVLELKIPLSEIYIYKGASDADGRISGRGWPDCNDENGWGPGGFLNSDCFWVLLQRTECLADLSGHMDGNNSKRYCQHNVRNCSPLISHPREWHTH
jgi:hypothetical protein